MKHIEPVERTPAHSDQNDTARRNNQLREDAKDDAPHDGSHIKPSHDPNSQEWIQIRSGFFN